MQITEINIYPVKSTAPLTLKECMVEPRGLAGDRNWMVVDSDNKAITARQCHALLLIQSELMTDRLTLSAPDHGEIRVSKSNMSTCELVEVWSDQCQANIANDKVNQWLSKLLGRECRLVKMADQFHRHIDPDYANPDDAVRFSDAFPVLLTSETSLADLNEQASSEIIMRRFRANIVIDGTRAYAEDDWKQIKIGSVIFDVVKPCDRCILTTIDPLTATRNIDQEPLKTLLKHRRLDGNHVYFGQNLIPRSSGIIKIGNSINVIA